ncbi:MAG TPA: TlyA family RNA methyltransferase [Nitrospiria bacterium]|nr:TlyA family RNA methyltransferase [Nitrospiria bacterium]
MAGVRPHRQRADVALVERGLAPSRARAQAMILEGLVRSGDRPVAKAGDLIAEDAPLSVTGADHPYVSRGGVKLAAALDAFAVDPRGLVCLDVGASTGGFTDCLLQRGAVRVWAVDVGYGQLAWSLRTDPRVRLLERANIRTLAREAITEPIDLAVIDVSFISLRLVLPRVAQLVRPGGGIIALIKPQFEVGREHVGSGGIVRDSAQRARAVQEVRIAAEALGLRCEGTIPSPIEGRDGNQEYLIALAAVARDA